MHFNHQEYHLHTLSLSNKLTDSSEPQFLPVLNKVIPTLQKDNMYFPDIVDAQ